MQSLKLTNKDLQHACVYNPATSYIQDLLQAGLSLFTIKKYSGLSQSTLYRLSHGKTKRSRTKTFKLVLATYCNFMVH